MSGCVLFVSVMDFFRFCITAGLLLGTFQNTIKTPKGAAPLGVFLVLDARQMRIGITTYLNSSFSGIVISALELASPKAHLAACRPSGSRSTSSRYVTLNPMSTLSPSYAISSSSCASSWSALVDMIFNCARLDDAGARP